jgi:hypothetical protein
MALLYYFQYFCVWRGEWRFAVPCRRTKLNCFWFRAKKSKLTKVRNVTSKFNLKEVRPLSSRDGMSRLVIDRHLSDVNIASLFQSMYVHVKTTQLFVSCEFLCLARSLSLL